MRYTILILSVLLGFSSTQAQRLKMYEKKMLKRVKKDITYLASDALMGRPTGSQGELASAMYIAQQFSKLGVSPAGEVGYMQTFRLVSLRTAAKGSFTINEENKYTLFKDFYPLSLSKNEVKKKGELLDVGFGISEPGKLSNYDSVDVLGKFALINIGSPDGIHPHSEYLKWHGIEIRVNEAIKHGARGVIFYGGKPPKGELAKTTEVKKIPVMYWSSLKDVSKVNHQKIDLEYTILNEIQKANNVLGLVDNGAEHTVVIGAHHDHLGVGEIRGSLEEKQGQIHNGADDNASGVAAMIELAKQIKNDDKTFSNYNYLFIAFSGEEMGLIGSKYYVNHPTIPLNKLSYMINMDMVGMLNKESKTLVINGVGTSPSFIPLINKLGGTVRGIDTVKTTKSGIGASDHTSFYLANIPAVHFFTGQHSHYHRSTDDVENLNLKGEVAVIQYICAFAAQLDSEERLAFSKTTEEDKAGRMKFKVTLGIMPDYVYAGEGMRVDGVKEGRVGDQAGMKKGDKIVQMNGVIITDIMDYMKALGGLEKGDECIVIVNRDGEMVELKVKF